MLADADSLAFHGWCVPQTNLMVRPYGNYRFTDYTKFGFPLQIGATLISTIMTMLLIK